MMCNVTSLLDIKSFKKYIHIYIVFYYTTLALMKQENVDVQCLYVPLRGCKSAHDILVQGLRG